MKKYLSILLAMLCVFGFAASAFAMHADIPSETTAAIAQGSTQITLSGQIRARYNWQHTGFNSNDSQAEATYMDERIRLGVLAVMSPNTTGFIELSSEADPASSGTASYDNMYGGSGGTGVGGSGKSDSYGLAGGVGNELKGTVSIRNMWILYKGTGLLGVESGIKVGHMPMSLGSGLFFDHTYFGDDGIIAYVFPVKELEVAGVVNIAEVDGINNPPLGSALTTSLSNKATGYVLLANYKPSKTTSISGDVTFFNVQNVGETTTTTNDFGSIHLWNFALRGNTEVSGVRLKIDGELQTGDFLTSFTPNTHVTVPATTMHGYAVQGGIGYTVDPVMLDVEVGYGSGDSGKNSTKANSFYTAEGPESTFGDPNRYSHGVQGPYVYNYRTVNATNIQYGGLSNTMYVRLGGNADLTKGLNFDAAFFFLQAANAITASNVNLYGFSASNVAAAGYKASHDIGEEIDAKLTYKLDKGLQTWVEGGYLWAGDFWKAVSTVTPGQKPSNCYTARTGIQFDF